VGQQHDRFLGQRPGQRAVLRRVQVEDGATGGGRPRRIEQAKLALLPQHPGRRPVDERALRAYLHVLRVGLTTASIVMLGISSWHLLRDRNIELFRRAAKLALIVAVPATSVQGALQKGESQQYVQDINGEANRIAAMLCRTDGMEPAAVCTRPALKRWESQG